MAETGNSCVPGPMSVSNRQKAWIQRKANGQFLTKQLAVTEKQFESLKSWGAKNGVAIERYVNKGGGSKNGTGASTETNEG